jgi:hypothetical protein
MLGFKSFEAAQSTLTGIELMHLIRKRQLVGGVGQEGLATAEQFYALAA